MVYNNGITFQERQLILQLRERVRHELPHSELSKSEEDQDLFLVRWIRARENNLDKARDMLLKSLEWRKTRNVDKMLNVELHPFFTENFQYSFAGAAKTGHPVILIPFSEWNFKNAARIPDALNHFEAFATKFLEIVLNQIKIANETRKNGHPPITQALFILDCKNFPYGQIFNLGAVKKILKLGGTYEANYPEVLFRGIFINIPSYFGLAISTVKPILAPKTLEKFSLYPSMSQWKKDITDVVDPSFLSERYGGTAQNI